MSCGWLAWGKRKRGQNYTPLGLIGSYLWWVSVSMYLRASSLMLASSFFFSCPSLAESVSLVGNEGKKPFSFSAFLFFYPFSCVELLIGFPAISIPQHVLFTVLPAFSPCERGTPPVRFPGLLDCVRVRRLHMSFRCNSCDL